VSRGYETGTPLNLVDDFGAIGDGVYDNAVEITAAVATLSASHRQGRRLYIPSGAYRTSAQIDLSGQFGIILEGAGNGETGGAIASAKMIYTGTGAQFINAQHSVGVVIRGLQILNSNAGFSGALVNGDNIGGSDTSFLRVEDCYIGGTSGGYQKAVGVSLAQATASSVRRCNFNGCTVAIRGKTTNLGYSNQITITDNHFLLQTVAHVKNAAEAWWISGNVFEALQGGGAAAYTHDAGVFHKSLVIENNWLGDITAGGSQFTVGGSFGTTISRNYIGFNAAATGITIDANNMDTLVIEGNTFDGSTGKLIDFGATTGHVGVVIGPNRETGSGAYVTGATAGMYILTGNVANPSLLPTTTVTTTYQVLATDYIVFAQSGGGAYTITLPTPVGFAGNEYVIKHTTGANLVTLATAAGQIDGAATYTGMAAANSSVTVVSDGANWFTIASR